jgi:uncharacterized membrane protein YdjX (TVP38/TMEM64 family)
MTVNAASRSLTTRTLQSRWTLLAVVVALGASAYLLLRDQFTAQVLLDHETAVRAYHHNHPILMVVLALATYAAVTSFPVPGAAVLTLLYGWYFGVVAGSAIVNFGATGGAILGFLQSRYFFRDFIQSRFGSQLHSINKALKQEGGWYLLTLRLVPVVPFFLLNTLMGLTPIRLRTYWWASQIGMLPATVVYVYAGSTVPDLQTLTQANPSDILSPQLFIAFALLGIFPFAVKAIMRRIRHL